MTTKTAKAPGARVVVVGGVWRGRRGMVCGAADGTNSQRVTLDHRSEYDKGRQKDWAWIPVEFLQERGECA